MDQVVYNELINWVCAQLKSVQFPEGSIAFKSDGTLVDEDEFKENMAKVTEAQDRLNAWADLLVKLNTIAPTQKNIIQ